MTTETADNQQLIIRGLRVAPLAARDHEILKGIDLTVGKGEVHAIMGPNGSGKTTLAYALMGHPAYVVKGGEVIWKGRDILKLPRVTPSSGTPRLRYLTLLASTSHSIPLHPLVGCRGFQPNGTSPSWRTAWCNVGSVGSG